MTRAEEDGRVVGWFSTYGSTRDVTTLQPERIINHN
jgi:hypothetical protein